MTKADRYLGHEICDILSEGYKDINPRPKYADGTPAHTISINQVMRKYDLSKGEFPICTLRPMAWKTAIREVMAIFINQSNKGSELERMGIAWWKPWYMEDGTIGKSYPYNLESHRPNEAKKLVKKVERRYVNKKYANLKPVPVFDGLPSVDGIVYLNRYKNVGINEELTDEKHTYYNIQFINNNYITTIRKDSLGKSKGINPYERTTYGIGYLDLYNVVNNFTEEEITILKDKWENMFRRCYSKAYSKEHPTYKNTFVHQDWHSFKQFLEDVRYLPQYFLAKEDGFKGWDLDKDYYGSNAYSKDTCVFLKHSENTLYSRVKGCYKIIDENTQKEYYEINLSDFARSIDEPQQTVQKAVTKHKKFKNFLFEYMYNNGQYVYRYELSRNQVNELIKDIQENPYGRRHIISFWNWANIQEKALVECAYETLWNVRGEYLDMTLIQRSGDMLTASGAGGMNEIQYAALLMMIARHTGYKAGVFCHFVQNEQIYDRHEEQAMEIFSRFKKLLVHEEDEIIRPELILNPEKNNFYDFTIEDFTLLDYEPIRPQLKLDLGI